MVSIYSELLRLADDVNEIEEHIPGGLGDLEDLGGVDPEQLAKGIIVEYNEHTDDPLSALEITLDHLSEAKGEPYYNFLDDMEGEMGEEGSEDHEESEDHEDLDDDVGEDLYCLEDAESECAEAEKSLAASRKSSSEEDGLKGRVKNFFLKNPEVTDDEVHAFANSIGVEKSAVENEIYKYLSEMLGVPEQAPSEDDMEDGDGYPESDGESADEMSVTPEGDAPKDLPEDDEADFSDDFDEAGDDEGEADFSDDFVEGDDSEDDVDFSDDESAEEQDGKRVVVNK